MNSCINPFAPSIDENLGTETGLISDQKSVEGVFQNLKYAYTFKDTSIYSQLLDKDFTFSYRDYDIGADVSWGRDEEMMITYNLFESTQSLNLVWNDIVAVSGDSSSITRSFDLTITYSADAIDYVTGKVIFGLAKDSDQKWKIRSWYDDSDY